VLINTLSRPALPAVRSIDSPGNNSAADKTHMDMQTPDIHTDTPVPFANKARIPGSKANTRPDSGTPRQVAA
jgi:hypothetical protein